MKQLRIAHLYANNQNLGDWGSAEGVKQQLRTQYKDVVFTDFFLSFRDLSRAEVESINTTCDLVVIGGGGLLYPRSKGLLLRLTEATLSRIKKPIILYAVGINYEPRDAHLLSAYMQQLERARNLFQLVSVRDVSSQDVLGRVHIPTHLVPCPSIFLPKNAQAFPLPKHDQQPRLGIVPVPLERFDKTKANNYLHVLTSFITQTQNTYACYLIGHNTVTDPVYEHISQTVQLPLILPVNPWQLMRAYDQMHVLVGSRGHMGMFALGSCKPFLFLSYNVKCEGFAKLLDYPEKLILSVSTLTTDSLLKAFQTLRHEEHAVVSMFDEKKKAIAERHAVFLKQILQLVS